MENKHIFLVLGLAVVISLLTSITSTFTGYSVDSADNSDAKTITIAEHNTVYLDYRRVDVNLIGWNSDRATPYASVTVWVYNPATFKSSDGKTIKINKGETATVNDITMTMNDMVYSPGNSNIVASLEALPAASEKPEESVVIKAKAIPEDALATYTGVKDLLRNAVTAETKTGTDSCDSACLDVSSEKNCILAAIEGGKFVSCRATGPGISCLCA